MINRKIKTFGIQLYSLRDIMANDTENILRQLASFGYKQIESYEGPKGMFWGFGPAGFKKRIEDLGMKLISSHCDMTKDFERKMHDAIEAGMTYIICPSEPGGKKLDDYKKLADELNSKGELCRNNGIRFAFHNHDFSFLTQDGSTGEEILLKNTSPDNVYFQMDIFWTVTAGQDPIEWLNKYPGRFKLCHIKDRSKNPTPGRDNNTVDLGTGTIDFSKILKLAARQGVDYYIVEQESYPNGSSLEAARVDANYMKNLKI